MASLTHERTSSECTFRASGTNGPIGVADWTATHDLCLESGLKAHVGALLRLLEDEAALSPDEYSISVPWSSIATLSTPSLAGIGLPEPAPVSIQLFGEGGFSDPGFRIRGTLRDRNGNTVLLSRREGGVLSVGGKEWIIAEPVFSILEGVERVNALTEGHTQDRMLAWGQLKDLLPADATVDNFLNETTITIASCVELQLRIDDDGAPTVDPIPGRYRCEETLEGEAPRIFEEVLPAARTIDFHRKFDNTKRVKSLYSAGAGSYLVFTPEARRLLRAVKEIQKSAPDVRREAIQNIHSFLRAKLDDDPETEDLLLDDVLSAEGFGDRVQGIGEWQRRSLPWVRREGNLWIPDEDPGEPGTTLSPEKQRLLLQHLLDARRNGIETITFEGVDYPVSDELIRRLHNELPPEAPDSPGEAAVEETDPSPPNDGDGEPGMEDVFDIPETGVLPIQPSYPYRPCIDRVLIVVDNLEHVAYERNPGARPGDIGRMPSSLEATLHPHQKEAVLWLQSHWANGTPGSLLADDMGLGKTLESLAFMAWIRELQNRSEVSRSPMLIVAPTGLLQNWSDEISRHLSTDGLGRILQAYGSGLRELKHSAPPGKDSSEASLGLATLDLREIRSADCVLTTYETLRDYQISFGQVGWCVAVFDEAQKIKNPSARVTDAALAMNIDFAVTMTGTPVENRPADIWSLIERSQPGVLHSLKEFSKKYEGDHADDSELSELRNRLIERDAPPVMLRRLKEDHLHGIPKKIEHRREVEMPPLQADAYASAVESAGEEGVTMLGTIQRLRSVSLHPEKPFSQDDESYIRSSARLAETFRILDEVRNQGERALIFIESIEMQDFLVEAIPRRYALRNPVLVINGKISGKKRQDRVAEFQTREAFDVMLLSPKAGGVGLTLTGANHVIHLSRWWNAAVEDQCTDRVYRIGQTKTVHVYFPMAVHPTYGESSFDVLLDGLISRKRGLNRSILAPTSATRSDTETLIAIATGVTCPPGDSGDSNGGSSFIGLETIDLMEPLRFERWTVEELRHADFVASLTTRQDGGADGIGHRSSKGQEETVLVQCKHT